MKIVIPKVTQTQLQTATKKILENGGAISDDGDFMVRGVEGSFKQVGESIVIDILKKPWLASWSMIETEIRKFFK